MHSHGSLVPAGMVSLASSVPCFFDLFYFSVQFISILIKLSYLYTGFSLNAEGEGK